MSLYENNLQFLRQTHPSLADRVLKAADDVSASLKETKTTVPTLLIQKDNQYHALHHPEDPLAHGEQFLSSLDKLPEKHNLALIGFGLGYLPLQILHRRPDLRHLLIFEPSITVFRTALQRVNLSTLLQHPSLRFVVGADLGEIQRALYENLMDYMANPPLLIETPSTQSIFPLWTDKIRQMFHETIQFGHSGLITKFRDGPLCLRNLLHNLESLSKTPPLHLIKNLLEDIPAVVVAAGPSLEKNIETLKEIQNRWLILATDTAFEPLRKRDLQPHMVVTVDPTAWNEKHFPHEHYNETTWLLYDPEARPEIVNKFNQSLTFCTDKHPFFDWLAQQLGHSGKIKKGAMVSQAAIQCAQQLGCSPIILVGQDLALDQESGATHASGTALQRNVRFFQEDQRHVNVPHLIEKENWYKEPLFWVEGIDGETVPTVQNLLVYLRLLEEDLRHISTPVIDATEGGAKIAGTTIMPLSQAIQEYNPQGFPKKWHMLTQILQQFTPKDPSPLKEHLLHLLNQKQEMAQDGLHSLEQNSVMEYDSLQKILESFRKRIFSDAVSEYLIEFAAPQDVFEFLKLGPANADETQKVETLKSRYKSLLNAVHLANQRIRESIKT